jgi:hypothetical protein
VGGVLLALAALCKFLPAIFLPYLILENRRKSVAAYVLTVIVIGFATEGLLGWDRFQMFQPGTATNHGVPSLDAMLGLSPITLPSFKRGSFYTFILSFFSDIDLAANVPTVTLRANSFQLPNLMFAGIVVFMIAATAPLVRAAKGDLLLQFAVVTSLMLVMFPYANPHYYIFALFGMFALLRAALRAHENASVSSLTRIVVTTGFVILALLFGEFIPFSAYDQVFRWKSPYFHVLSVYGIQGLATFLLWCCLAVGAVAAPSLFLQRPADET